MTVLAEVARIGDCLRFWADRRPAGEALVCGGTRLTFGQLSELTSKLARALAATGVARGERVAAVCPPGLEAVTVFLAATDIGAVFVGLNPAATTEEWRRCLAIAQPAVIFAASDHDGQRVAERAGLLADDLGYPCRLVALDRTLSGTAFDSFARTTGEVSTEALNARRAEVKPEDPALIVYTSGSAGAPKGAVLTHRSALAGMTAQARHLRLDSTSRSLMHIPISHFGSVGNVLLSTLIAGGTVCTLERFTPRSTLDLIERERVSVWGQVPTMFLMQLAVPDFDSFDLSSVSTIFFSGSAIPAETVRRLSRLDAMLFTGYGGTEMSGPVSLSGPDASVEELCETVGVPLPEFEVAIFAGEGRPADQGTVGEVCVRGACVFAGYHRDPEATAAVLDDDGWYHSGDLGLIDPGGRLRLVGRLGDGFRSGGVTVYPREIELVLEQHPAVAAACVVEVTDPLFQHVAHGFVVAAPGREPSSEQLREHCRERLINYKVPKSVWVLDELPMLAVGKIDRVALRRLAQTAGDQHPSRPSAAPGPVTARWSNEKGDSIDDI